MSGSLRGGECPERWYLGRRVSSADISEEHITVSRRSKCKGSGAGEYLPAILGTARRPGSGNINGNGLACWGVERMPVYDIDQTSQQMIGKTDCKKL